MAAMFRKSRGLMCILYILTLIFTNGLGSVHEVNKKTLAKFLKGKLFTVTFVDSPTCTRCRVLYPFFVAASQVFPHDPEIFFTRTHDTHLVQDWGITELPALVYHREGISNYEFMNVDVTVDDIIDEIARILFGNFAGLTRTYCVHVDEDNYDELIVTPKQSVMMLIHDKGDKEERETIEKVAHAFRKDDAVLFATLDVNKHRQLRDDRFKSKDTPVVMWMGAEHKTTPKRFGGVLSHPLLVQFVNEQTGLNRNRDGAMQEEAGRIPEADEVIEVNVDKIMEGNNEDLKGVVSLLNDLKETTATHLHEMLEYYVYIIDNIALAGNARIIRDLLRAVETSLFGGEETSTKQHEALKRQKNILRFFKGLEKAYSDEKKRKTREELQQKMEEKREKKMKKEEEKEEEEQEEVVEHTSGHSHVHTEL